MTTRRTFLQSLAALSGLPLLAPYAKGEDMTVNLPKKPWAGASINYEALLWAISQKETGGKDTIIGPSGERSKYGIMETVWSQHNTEVHGPFSSCRGNAAHWLGHRHLYWLDRNLPKVSMTEIYNRPYALAWCWHGGLSSWPHGTKKKPMRVLHAYATDVTNLMNDRLKTNPA